MSETTRIRLDKQIQKASKENKFPLSDINGELQYADVSTVVKAMETLTHLDTVEIVNGNLIIKYTAEDGKQQVVSTRLIISGQDINVSDAKMENPSAGVYRLIITETDGSTYPVDLSALLAVVTKNTEYITWSGNGTPATPLSIELTDKFWEKVPKVLDDLEDCTVTQTQIDEQLQVPGSTVLTYDPAARQWVPKSIATLDNYLEITERFQDLTTGDAIYLQYEINQLYPQSVKVFRNGNRQYLDVDYRLNPDGYPKNAIVFTESFTDRYPEKVIVDYRPLSLATAKDEKRG